MNLRVTGLAALLVAGACSGQKTTQGGSGGSAGNGGAGSGGAGGTAGSAGSVGAGGSGGTACAFPYTGPNCPNTGCMVGTGNCGMPPGGTGGGGTAGSAGSGGSSVADGGTCSAPTTGPLATSDPSRPFGWAFTGAAADAGAADAGGTAGDAGAADGGATPARCQTVPATYPGTSCVGIASLQSTASGPVIVFGDGAQLAWDGTLPPALRPTLAQASGAGDSVWVDYEKRTIVVCPFCGAYTTYTLEIRNGQAGKIRFYDQQGAVLPNLTDARVMEIFGAPATATRSCAFSARAGCNSYLRSEFDHQLATTPPQTILDATLTEVTAPNGTFQVSLGLEQRVRRPFRHELRGRTRRRHRQRVRRRARGALALQPGDGEASGPSRRAARCGV